MVVPQPTRPPLRPILTNCPTAPQPTARPHPQPPDGRPFLPIFRPRPPRPFLPIFRPPSPSMRPPFLPPLGRAVRPMLAHPPNEWAAWSALGAAVALRGAGAAAWRGLAVGKWRAGRPRSANGGRPSGGWGGRSAGGRSVNWRAEGWAGWLPAIPEATTMRPPLYPCPKYPPKFTE
jgi:hypothetical protein